MDGQMVASVARDFRVSAKTVHKWVARFRAAGSTGLEDRSSRPHRIARRNLETCKELGEAVFALLHTPPRDSGFNRTTWRLADLHSALRTLGMLTTQNNLSIVIKQAGYQWKKARVTLTSSDPLYREKVDAIKKALSDLKDDEAFFSIDEFGPFAVTAGSAVRSSMASSRRVAPAPGRRRLARRAHDAADRRRRFDLSPGVTSP
jgi:transposase